MAALIVDHVWRPYPGNGHAPDRETGVIRGRGPLLERPCEYMKNCRRSRAEHERSVSMKFHPSPSGSAR